MAISPDDSQRCANEISAKSPALAISSFNFFGNQFPIYAAAKIPVIVGSPVTIGDYTSPGVYAIGGGGGCLGAHTALMYFATHQLKGKKIGIPWADTPPGVVCYYDLEAKPLDVLIGKVKSTSKEAGTMPDLTYLGVPIKPATPDITAQITQILDFKPDVITFSAQAADCWNLVSVLGRLGWTPDKIPLVMTGACVDLAAMRAAGNLAKGVYFITSGSGVLSDPATSTNVRAKAEAINYQTKPEQYGLAKDTSTTGFATLGWGTMMSLWEVSSQVAVSGQAVTGDSISAFYKATTNEHDYASTPLACAKAPTPYVAVCNSDATVSQWDGTNLVQVADRFTGIDLVAGTELKPGP
jgi:branched-chain amino acid transport system substrate-binding protein